ncbi:MBL fold metallo-hydrolase [Brevibacillus ginsengisoli]|uniref:MBL fold metallo-hydrolase n=1 Tax=Brevibacillus ginsengisoli TaxID=363854 RepID=UPI003CF90FB1
MNNLFMPITSITSGLGQEVRADLFCLPVQIVNVCFVGQPNQTKEWVLIDAGMPYSAEAIIGAAEERFGSGACPQAIILTHGHFDHVGALPELMKRWAVPIYAHEREMPYLTGQRNYPPADPTVDGGLVTEMSPFFPHEAIQLGDQVHPLPADGSIPFLADWKWIHTPGHTPGHVSLFRVKDHALIAGDAFVTVKQESLYKVIFQELEMSGPPKYFTTDWEAARESVERLEKLRPSVAVTGHGLPIEGELLSRELAKLVRDFGQIAVPEHGRYVTNS